MFVIYGVADGSIQTVEDMGLESGSRRSGSSGVECTRTFVLDSLLQVRRATDANIECFMDVASTWPFDVGIATRRRVEGTLWAELRIYVHNIILSFSLQLHSAALSGTKWHSCTRSSLLS